jgi:cephalosporin hydroxylase
MNRKKYVKMIQSVTGWHFVPDFFLTAEILDHILKKQNLKEVNFIEIGVYHGKSFLPIADYFYDRITTFHAADLFELEQGQMEVFKKNVSKYLPADHATKIHILKEDSLKLANHYPTGENSKKFIYCSIDGHHTYDHTLSDLKFCSERVHDKGIILLDDVYQHAWPEVGNAMVDFLRENREFTVAFILFNKVILTKDRSLVDELYDPAKYYHQQLSGIPLNVVNEELRYMSNVGFKRVMLKILNRMIDALNGTPE